MTAQAEGEARRSVLLRALSVLDAFEYRDQDISLAELTRRTGLPKPTVFRIVNELVGWGALERGESGYQLGVRLFMLGEKVHRQGSLRDLAMPYLEDLYEAIAGKWGYLEHDWTATAGDFVYEPPGEGHTLVAYDSGEAMKALFIVKGPLAWLDESGEVVGLFDVHDYRAMCREHYEKVGLGADLVDSLIR